jgi:large subunit ribosomal protein L14e
MNDTPLQVGQLVRSRAGRDQGRFFMVSALVDSEYVHLVDGQLRKMEKPKKKKRKHLESQKVYFSSLRQKLESGQTVYDYEVRQALQSAQQNEEA